MTVATGLAGKGVWLPPVFAGVAASGLFLASLLIPPIGFLLCLVSPLPLALAGWRRGPRAALLAAVAGAAVAALVAGPVGAVVFVTQFAVGGCALGLTARRGSSPATVIGSYTIATALGFGVAILAMAAAAGLGPLAFLQQTLDESVRQAMELLATGAADAGTAQTLQTLAEETSLLVTRAFAGAFLALALLTGWGNALALRRITRTQGQGNWNLWRAPENWIWVLIGSGLLALLTTGSPAVVALNVFIVAVAVYFLQGMAVVQYLFEARGFPRFLRAVAYVTLFQTPVMLLVAGLGAFDLWLDFRGRLAPPPATTGTNA